MARDSIFGTDKSTDTFFNSIFLSQPSLRRSGLYTYREQLACGMFQLGSLLSYSCEILMLYSLDKRRNNLTSATELIQFQWGRTLQYSVGLFFIGVGSSCTLPA